MNELARLHDLFSPYGFGECAVPLDDRQRRMLRLGAAYIDDAGGYCEPAPEPADRKWSERAFDGMDRGHPTTKSQWREEHR